MGKYPNSTLHNEYSDWHWNLIKQNSKYKKLYVSDIDRLWIEYDFEKRDVVGVIDIKKEELLDSITPTEKGIYEWFEQKGAKVFTVFINQNFTRFTIINGKGNAIVLESLEYADFLLSLRNPRNYRDFIKEKNNEGKIKNIKDIQYLDETQKDYIYKQQKLF